MGLNSQYFLKNGGNFVISIKASCIDSTAPPEAVFAREVKKLQEQQLKPKEQVGGAAGWVPGPGAACPLRACDSPRWEHCSPCPWCTAPLHASFYLLLPVNPLGWVTTLYHSGMPAAGRAALGRARAVGRLPCVTLLP